MSDDPTPTEEDLLDAADQAALLDDEAATRVGIAEEIAEAAEEAEADAIVAGDVEEAERIDEQATEIITELVGEATEEARLAVHLAPEQRDDARSFLQPMLEDGLVEITNGTLSLTEQGTPFLRNACMFFDQRLRRQEQQPQMFSQAL